MSAARPTLHALTIANLGPHTSTAIPLDGVVRIGGRSECGKTFVADALALALWGCTADGSPMPTAMIRDGAKAASVTLHVEVGGPDDDLTLTRTRDRKGRWSREALTCYEDPIDTATEDQCRALHGLPADARYILAPMRWLALTGAPGGGRELRDLLERMLPGETTADVLARSLEPGEPDTEKAAMDYRREVTRQRDRAYGALDEARRAWKEAVAAVEPEPDPDDVEDARLTVEAAAGADAAAKAHAMWRMLRDQHTDALTRRAAQEAAVVQPARQRPTEAVLSMAREEVDRTSWAVDAAAGEHAAAGVAVDEALRLSRAVKDARERAENRYLDAKRDPTPVTCANAGPGCAALAIQQAADKAHAMALAEWTEAKALHKHDAEEVADRLRVAMATALGAERALEDARKRHAEAVAALDDLLALELAWLAHNQRRASLGPALPPFAQPEPEVVTVDNAALTAARDTLRRVTRTAEQRQRVEDAQAKRDARQVECAAHDARLARAEELVVIVRAAPGVALRGKLATLGDTGPVGMEVPEDDGDGKADALVVTIDGRPWQLASTGRRVVADALFRAALRRGADLPTVPIVIDEVQSIGGQPVPDVAAPAVYLTTTDGDWAVEVD